MLASRKLLVGAVAASVLACVARAAENVYEFAAEHERWRVAHVAKLTAPDGWLTLIGLHYLKPGTNTVGAAKDNAVVLAKGPAHLGTVTVGADGKVMLDVASPADVRVDGAEVRHAELKWDTPAQRTLVTAGSVTIFVVDRAGQKALRVKDSESPRRRQFAGLDFFPLDPTWRIEARWEPFEKLRMIPVVNIAGQTEPTLVAGKAVFEREGRKIELIAIDEGPTLPLFFVISDLTSGRATYGGGRHLYAERPAEGARRIVLDFNRAENPPCAFTPFSTCPVPPKENRLPFAVRVGEKTYLGSHD